MGQTSDLTGKRAELYEAGVTAGYPEMQYRQDESIQAGRGNWERFCRLAGAARIDDALKAATTLE